MPGTRLRVLSMFLEWAKNDPMRVFWLAGLAGTGKTSIAVTLCRMLQNEPSVLFGGAFFCSRTANVSELTDVRCILPTLATSLAAQSHEFATSLKRQLDADSIAASKPISAQIDVLLKRPLVALSSAARSIVFVVDALDECSDENQVKKLLEAISVFRCEATVKFILTSRPETHISASPVSSSDHNTILRLHTIDKAEVEEDIRMYIDYAFSKHPLDEEWYTELDVSTLALHADGLFIFASTVVAYVLDIESVDGRVARLRKATHAMKSSTVATGPLDAIYEFVLMRALDTTKAEQDEIDATRKVLACVLTAKTPLSTVALAEILGWKSDALHASLRRLRAVVYVPEEADQPGLRAVHASFGDYLLERAIAKFRITGMLGHEAFARGSLRIMKERLHFNISQNQSSHVPNSSENPRETSQYLWSRFSREPSSPTRPDHLTLSVEYACLQWAYHLADLQRPDIMDHHISNDFCPVFLFWLEVMSVLRRVSRATSMLLIAASTVQLSELSLFLRDAHAFVSSSREAIELSAPHIYLSALPFAAVDSRIYKTFYPLCAGLISVNTFGIDRHGGRLVMTLKGHTQVVSSVSYTPDGRLISASWDKTLRIWDPHTGEEAKDFSSDNGTDDSVSFMAVDPTGQYLASGYDSGNVDIWNLQSPRHPSQRLSGLFNWVTCISFSPDGRFVATASWQYTARLWTVKTGQLLSVIGGPSEDVKAVAFSADGEILASGSFNTVLLWNGRTGQPVGSSTLGHNAHVTSLCFSPDGARLAVGFFDSTIILVEFSTMTILATLQGHLRTVISVQFSPDGRSLLSTSFEGPARLWSLQEGVDDISSIAIGHHSCSMRSAVFSPDGLYIASNGYGDDIMIWDAGSSRQAAEPFEAHSEDVSSVVASKDGAFIFSGSFDGSARVWDVQTGEPISSLKAGHRGRVLSVAISPNSRLICTGRLGRTVSLWDASTGDEIGTEPHYYIASDFWVGILSSDAQWFALGYPNRTIRIWNVATWSPLRFSPELSKDNLLAIACSFDGQVVAVGDSGGTIHLWNIEAGSRSREPIQTQERHDSYFPIAFSHTGALMAYGGVDSIGNVWDISAGRKIVAFGPDSSLAEELTSIVFSSDDRLIGTGAYDSTVQLWNAATGEQLALIRGHNGPVWAITFAPDGQSIISGSSDSTIRIWNVAAARARSSNNSTDLAETIESTGLTNGWLLGESGELLLWIPPDYRANIELPSCRLLIASHRVTITTGETWYHGENWTSCWLGAPFA